VRGSDLPASGFIILYPYQAFMLYVWFGLVFALGACVGGVLNYCFDRLPWEKSIFWPGPRCGRCYRPIRWYDNVPLVSYWVLRGRCRACGSPISGRYFLVELCTGLVFAGLFYLEVVRNLLDLPFLRQHHAAIAGGDVPAGAWAVFACHAVLVSFLLLTSLCDLDDMAIPLPITVTGTLLGLAFAALSPWPYPSAVGVLPAAGRFQPPRLDSGLYPWPVWYPLPAWLPPGSWQLGLATGLAGAAAGMICLRAVRFLFGLGRGIEGLGVGDADLMMMAGSFVGWQPVLVSFFVALGPGLFFGVAQVVRRGEQALPFGPSLALGVVLTVWLWPLIGDVEPLRLLFFDPIFLAVVAGAGAGMLLAISFLLRLGRGTPPQAESP
jgi:leader peptidase (prepilin peptidase)/N-methyltransferase